MMKLLSWMLVAAMVLMLAMGSATFADGGKTKSGKGKAAQTTKTSGEITKLVGSVLTLTPTGGTAQNFAVDTHTEITVDGKKAAASDLKVGQIATIEYDKQNKAVTIAIGALKKSKG